MLYVSVIIVPVGVVVVVVSVVGILLFLSTPPTVVVEPQKLDVSLSPGNSTVKTISIEAIGTGMGEREVRLSAAGPIVSWLKFSKNNEDFEDSITVDVDKTPYIIVNLSLQSNITPGDYRGAIEVYHSGGRVEIPVFVKIEG